MLSTKMFLVRVIAWIHPLSGKLFHFISKPRVSDTWAWRTGALLALCETKGLRQDFPLLQVGKQGLIKVSTPDHRGCKFVHLDPQEFFQASCGTPNGLKPYHMFDATFSHIAYPPLCTNLGSQTSTQIIFSGSQTFDE